MDLSPRLRGKNALSGQQRPAYRGATWLIRMLLVLVVLLPATVQANSGVITTVAGKGLGDGGPASSASLRRPHGVAVDAAGNIYIADSGNHCIRRVNAADGKIHTVAGNGESGYSGDGGAAISASTHYPYSISVDASGNIYFGTGYCIRRVSAADGTISTVAGNGEWGYSGDGGPATSASFASIDGVSVDASGNIYIADWGNNRIRKVNAIDGIISTVAGNGEWDYSGDGGAATLAGLSAGNVSVDASGNIYIADSMNCRIRKVKATDGTISTVAGSGEWGIGYSGEGGPATLAIISAPSTVSVDAAGNIYLSDYNYGRIWKVNAADGIISTMAGHGEYGFSGDGGPATQASFMYVQIAVDAMGNIYLADEDNNRLRKVNAADGKISTVIGKDIGDGRAATSATLGYLGDVAVDRSGNIYIADAGNRRIRKVNAADGMIGTVAGKGEWGWGEATGDGGVATSANLSVPSGVAVDASGNIYIADLGAAVIRKVAAADGTISTVAGNGEWGYPGDGGQATLASLNSPYDVAVDATGNIYIADSGNNRIRKVTVADGTISTVAGNGKREYSGDGGSATLASINHPTSIAVDASGNIYIADAGNNRIRKVDAVDGTISTVAGNFGVGYSGDGGAATLANFSWITGVAVDDLGNIYIADSGNYCIRKVNAADGIISTVAGNGEEGYSGDRGPATLASLGGHLGIAVDAAGKIYIADSGNNRIRMVAGWPGAPVVSGTTPTRDTTPKWSWLSGGDGNGTFRYQLDSPGMVGATETSARTYAPETALSEGRHVLYVQERDQAGHWSASGSKAIVIDTTRPGAPVVSGTTPTRDTTPKWSWVSGGGGNGTFRYQLDSFKMVGATETSAKYYVPTAALSEGRHVLYVQERDQAGNWSPTGSKAIVIDTTRPGAPVVSSVTPTRDTTPKWSWLSGGGGSGTFRYQLDSFKMAGTTETRAKTFVPVTALSEGRHTLYVQERDLAGNWSASGSKAVVIDIN